LYLLEDVGHGGMTMEGVEEVEDMTEAEVMNNDVRKARRASLRATTEPNGNVSCLNGI